MARQIKMNPFLILRTILVHVALLAYDAVSMIHIGMPVVFGLIHVAHYEAFGLESALVA